MPVGPGHVWSMAGMVFWNKWLAKFLCNYQTVSASRVSRFLFQHKECRAFGQLE